MTTFIDSVKKWFLEEESSSPSEKSIITLLYEETSLTIDSCIGNRTIANAKKTFKSFIIPQYKEWDTNIPSYPTPDTPCQIYELNYREELIDIFSAISDDINSLCLTQDQIITFCTKYPEYLSNYPCATFFLFRVFDRFFVCAISVIPKDPGSNSDSFFVEGFGMCSSGLGASLGKLEKNFILKEKLSHHIVIPKLADVYY